MKKYILPVALTKNKGRYTGIECPIHHCKLAETFTGKKWCPQCVGEKMAKDTIAKVFGEKEVK
jgi:hypothetical protein